MSHNSNFGNSIRRLWRANQQWDLTSDTKNQLIDPKIVGFGSLYVKIGRELTKLWQYCKANPNSNLSKSPYIFGTGTGTGYPGNCEFGTVEPGNEKTG